MTDVYVTPEGFELPRALLLPAARTFSDVLEYVRPWDFATMNHTGGKVPRPDLRPDPVIIGGNEFGAGNEVGPFCSVDLSALGMSSRHLAVIARPAVIDVITPRLVTSDDHLSFKIIGHVKSGRALVILDHGYIIGSHWLAYIDPATIPYAERSA